MKTILITGGAGFIGSNFIIYFLGKYEEYFIVNLDKLTYAGDLKNLMELDGHQRYKFINGDICDKDLVEYIFREFNVKGVIHFAAESHVDNSIVRPEDFIRTNVLGTFVLLNAARNIWLDKPFSYKNEYAGSRFHHISTDEVYGSLGKEGFFTESTPYAPNSPYSASKASADMLVKSYRNTYGLNTVITNSSNNYGPRQHDEKLIPKIIRNALNGEPIPIYGDGENVRDWLYVEDQCKAIDMVFHKSRAGETYNIGVMNERKNIEVVNIICGILDELRPRNDGNSYKKQISFVEDRPGHDRRYAVDPSKIRNEFGWEAEKSFESGIFKTVNWYLEKYSTKVNALNRSQQL
ncbi:MAG: dTDP-glucose 4,6-dehydratase [Nitrospirae bacterium GWC2_46_6]|nr:MAG: dTDP-glucose 4,6-dehydratase [Nitrospirae bacterium GWC2_46_6]OGW24260.1 MAG: dTDP-glucose 4,6-dehydratase [Nitrospirae bacterium GWB2_47_37]